MLKQFIAILWSLFARPQHKPSESWKQLSARDIAEIFKRSPTSYFCLPSGRPYDYELNLWEGMGHFADKITVKVCGRQVAYAQALRVRTVDGRRVLSIGHFATETQYQHLGIGTAFAYAVAKEFARRHTVTRLIFAQNKAREHDPAFFGSLGATRHEPGNGELKDKNPDWVWDLPESICSSV